MPEPTGTYRLQLHAGFGFGAAQQQVPYLADLGVSHLYLSPVLQAAPGSMHGYDVLDHSRVSDELGGAAALVSLADSAHRHGLGVVVDVVPNHMALVPPEHLNRPLWEVLRRGRDAATAHWFDIDWDAGAGRLALPLLGDTLEQTLAAGELTFDEVGGEPVVRYHDHVFPLAAGTAGSGADGAADACDVGAVLQRQHYRLASWRDKDAVLNYRRFFDVDSLIAVRVEEPDVFEATHRVLLDLHARGVVDGFRIDHPDGLADPEGYLQRLHEATGGAWVLVEKILEPGEALPRSWACAGTTGYDAILAVQTALVDPAATPTLDRVWADAGGDPDLHRVEQAAKREAVDLMLGAEVDRLCRSAVAATGHADVPRLRAALVELLVGVDVYRAYVRPGEPVDVESAQRLRRARDRAVAARPDLSDEVDVLVGLAQGLVAGEAVLPAPSVASPPPAGVGEAGEQAVTSRSGARERAVRDFVVRFQQTCGPVMAKGVEDTTFYRWHRLVALNEVGGDPAAVQNAGPAAMHAWATAQQRDWPRGLTALSTHDTKRSEDVRARLLAVSQHPRLWEESSTPFLEAADEAHVDRPSALLLWQTLLGAWPLSRERLHEYLRKAMREAKQHTAWVDGDAAYEARVLALADRALTPGPMRAAVESALAATTADVRATVLAAKLLQLCLPGVPDVYQGCELVTDSLVDPDNRRPVDFGRRTRMLARLDQEAGPAGPDLDQEKLLVTSRALRLRRDRADAFGPAGGYTPVEGSTEHVTGFLRGDAVAALATRAPARLAAAGGWGAATVTLPEGTWTDVLTGARHRGGGVACADVFAVLPVALLEAR